VTHAKAQTEALTKEIETLEVRLRKARDELRTFYESCEHEWGPVTYTPLMSCEYTDPGDPPSSYSIDTGLPVYVPGHTTPRWSRTCKCCGKVEYTERTNEHITRTPRF